MNEDTNIEYKSELNNKLKSVLTKQARSAD